MNEVISLSDRRDMDAAMTDLAALVDPSIAPAAYRSVMFSLRPMTPAETDARGLSGESLLMVTTAETQNGKPTFSRFAARLNDDRLLAGQWTDCPHLAFFQALDWLEETQPEWMIAAQRKAARP